MALVKIRELNVMVHPMRMPTHQKEAVFHRYKDVATRIGCYENMAFMLILGNQENASQLSLARFAEKQIKPERLIIKRTELDTVSAIVSGMKLAKFHLQEKSKIILMGELTLADFDRMRLRLRVGMLQFSNLNVEPAFNPHFSFENI